MPKVFPIVVRKTTVVAGGDADVVWNETEHLTDKPVPKPTLPDSLHTTDHVSAVQPVLPQTLHVTDHTSSIAPVLSQTLHVPDKLVPVPILPQTLHSTDKIGLAQPIIPQTLHPTSSRQVPALSLNYPEMLHSTDTFKGSISGWKTNRSGSPDSDAYGDAWVDGVLANQGVNHGNESPITCSDQALLVTERDAYMAWDLTRFVNLSAPTGGTMVLSYFYSHTIALGVNVVAKFSKFAARPFVESTITWTNKPADGSSLVTKNVFSAFIDIGGTATLQTVSLTAAEYGPYLGSWMMVHFTSDATALATYSITSREGTTVAQRPVLAFDFKR